jgi:hypothetical protein
MRPLFPAVSPWKLDLETGACPLWLLILQSLRFSLCAPLAQRAKFSPLSFPSPARSFSFFAEDQYAISLLFNHFHNLLQESRGS